MENVDRFSSHLILLKIYLKMKNCHSVNHILLTYKESHYRPCGELHGQGINNNNK